MSTIKIAGWSTTPGSRYKSEGQFSGEEYREVMKNFFDRHDRPWDNLFVDLDGTCGYSTGFLEEVFGGLIREGYGPKVDKLSYISTEEPYLVDEIKEYIEDAKEERRRWWRGKNHTITTTFKVDDNGFLVYTAEAVGGLYKESAYYKDRAEEKLIWAIEADHRSLFQHGKS